MEPRIGTGYTFSERSEFHGTQKYIKNNDKPRLGEQGSLRCAKHETELVFAEPFVKINNANSL